MNPTQRKGASRSQKAVEQSIDREATGAAMATTEKKREVLCLVESYKVSPSEST